MSGNTSIDRLLAERGRFRAFLISRLGNESDADEVLQTGLVKALESSGDVRDGEKVTAWFFQVLRNAIVDHVRSRRAAAAREETWATQTTLLADDDETHRTLCGCYEGMLGGMKPREAELLRRVELGGEPVAEVARELGLTANNAGVILHRARKQLREALTRFCGDCANGACLDCDCSPDDR